MYGVSGHLLDDHVRQRGQHPDHADRRPDQRAGGRCRSAQRGDGTDHRHHRTDRQHQPAKDLADTAHGLLGRLGLAYFLLIFLGLDPHEILAGGLHGQEQLLVGLQLPVGRIAQQFDQSRHRQDQRSGGVQVFLVCLVGGRVPDGQVLNLPDQRFGLDGRNFGGIEQPHMALCGLPEALLQSVDNAHRPVASGQRPGVFR